MAIVVPLLADIADEDAGTALGNGREGDDEGLKTVDDTVGAEVNDNGTMVETLVGFKEGMV